eukprot:CAMPEP_0196767414 /NCGR_PEP_ID=MMETSP1095-20130614/40796_1 /TAXON_ID=96789 ORGANISM="Chromulina nebulosa, Strain UTEXLB2642" /NCGR_SAMPLE_ID=MMETSP1095 /ASSEMBLY_ACC=CAM_ASM_000446 /LENGTH=413 /DNA_ID=CAMNT_0042135519 /DNA_START=62 /DNA_END=1300 /DNA_ORIENTATION=+
MVTTWNWIILTDFASFKPATIPDDDLTDFQYYFDTMSRRRCSVAPERFVKKSNINNNVKAKGDDFVNDNSENGNSLRSTNKVALNVPMDVFSLGCTIAEVFLDGEPLLDLPGILKYAAAGSSSRNFSSSPNQAINTPYERLDQDESPAKAGLLKITNKLIRKVVIDMTQRDPDVRLSVQQYRLLLQGGVSLDNSKNDTKSINTTMSSDEKKKPTITAFPLYFETVLYPLFLKLHWKGSTPDDRIGIICESYGDIIESISDIADEKGQMFFSKTMLDICFSSKVENVLEKQEQIVKELERDSLLRARTSSNKDERNSLDEINAILTNITNKPNRTKSDNSINVNDTSKTSNVKLDELIIRCKSFLNEIESKYKDSNNNDNAVIDMSSDKLIDDSMNVIEESDKYTNSGSFFRDW